MYKSEDRLRLFGKKAMLCKKAQMFAIALSLFLCSCVNMQGGPCEYISFKGFSEVVQMNGDDILLHFYPQEDHSYEHASILQRNHITGFEFHFSSQELANPEVGARYSTEAHMLTYGTCTPIHFDVGKLR